MNDFSESGAAVRFGPAWGVDLEGKRNFDGRGVEIVTCAAVGAEIHACFAGVVRHGVWIRRRGRFEIAARSPGEAVGEIEDSPLLHPRGEM